MNERRIARLQEQIKQRLAEILLRDLADPHLGFVTITRIELDAEFTQCKAYWSVIGDSKQQQKSEEVLRKARGLCQREVGKGLHTRTIPHLEFVFDQGIGGAIRVNQLLQELQQERENRPPATPEPEPPTPPAPPTKPG